MNKIFNVNLGGYPFTIDDDAYQSLQGYLNTIRKHFSSSEGCDDIIYDIEVRLAELFQENLQGEQIVTQKNLDQAIAIMGTPADFGAIEDEMEETPVHQEAPKKGKKRKIKIKTGRRLFRDPEDKVIGGVCSGIAAYFGVQDPLWIRLAAVIFMVAGGVVVIPYILLMIIVPEATTSGDKLAMKGEPINVENIAKTVEEEISHLVDKGTETIEATFGSKKKKR